VDAQTIVERLEQTETADSAWVTRLIREGPLSGVNGGGHGWLYKAAKGLFYYRRRHKLTEQDFFIVLRAKADGYERRVPDEEIEEAIESAARHLEDPDYQTGIAQKSWAEPDYEKVSEIVTAGFGFRELTEASPVNHVTSDQVVSCLFSRDPDSLICAAPCENNPVTKPLSRWLKGESWLNEKLSQQSFIVPNPMRNEGRRCLDNTGARMYLVIECDISKADRHDAPTRWASWIEKWEQQGLTIADACAAIVWHLHRYAPLVLAVHSGGKSVHGWFPCRGVEEDKLKPFMQYTVLVGADRANWTRCQLVRMPGGARANGKHQRVLYFDPETITRRMEAAI
jgi:hypothetical protein